MRCRRCRGFDFSAGIRVVCLAVLAVALFAVVAEGATQTIHGCRLGEGAWADGDSFPVILPDGRTVALRLYGADCIEWQVGDETMARRLRAQRRYFGIGGGDVPESMAKAREFARKAAERTRELLAEPFDVETAFSKTPGGGRVYGFVATASGQDLAAVLVREGLARAHGIARQRSDGTTASGYRESLADLELTAAAARRGVWAETDWERIAEDRAQERREAEELESLMAGAKLGQGGLDPNTATAEDFESLPGIGAVLAERIVSARGEGRFESPQDLLRIRGMSPAKLKAIEGRLNFPAR